MIGGYNKNLRYNYRGNYCTADINTLTQYNTILISSPIIKSFIKTEANNCPKQSNSILSRVNIKQNQSLDCPAGMKNSYPDQIWNGPYGWKDKLMFNVVHLENQEWDNITTTSYNFYSIFDQV